MTSRRLAALVSLACSALPLAARAAEDRDLPGQVPATRAASAHAPGAPTARATRPPRAPRAAGSSAGVRLTTDHLLGLALRAIGPANMGGRVSEVALVPGRPSSFLVATASGGIFRTANGGTTFTPVFDDAAVSAIGSIAIAPSDPQVVYAGTGEGNGRNSSTWGDGVYVSTDGGASFVKTGPAAGGLEDARDIPRLAVDPCDPRTVYAAVMGHLWGPSADRGLYRSSDGGATWQPLLRLDADTGCIDVALDPRDPDVIYAAMYARRRTPWSFRSGGFGDRGGIYRSTDRGRTFTRLGQGLPRKTGRIGLALSPRDPRHVFAVVEADDAGTSDLYSVLSRSGGVFRSLDGGDHWTRLHPLTPRPFYFSKIVVDPRDEDRLYVLGFGLYVSDDGGRSFRPDGAVRPHGDLHSLVIDPADPAHLLTGTDGGVYESRDRGATWRFLDNLALGQFYELGLGMDQPYTVCGGLQDNGTWCGPSRGRALFGESLEKQANASTQDWQFVWGGDGYYAQIDPRDPHLVYAEAQQGWIGRTDLTTGRQKVLRPLPKEGSPDFRFNWDSPFLLSRHDPDRLYLGGNHVFRLTERGDRFEVISPDLSSREVEKIVTAGSGAESHGTVVALAESPLVPGLLWAGTDDGNLHLTRDDGKTWERLTDRLPVPRGTYVSRLEPSHFDPAVCLASFDGHRTGDEDPRIAETRDFGKTWRTLDAGLPPGAPVRVIREDPEREDLLFAGTEFGLWLSIDRGRTWLPLRPKGFPAVQVHDLQIHPRDRDLVIGTHGRSIYVLDDLTALEQLTPAVIASRATLFRPRPATAFNLIERGGMWSNDRFAARNPPPGASINYWIGERSRDGATIAIADAKGRKVREIKGPAEAGLNRVVWDLQTEREARISTMESEWFPGAPPVVPAGTYTVTLTAAGERAMAELQVAYPPGVGPEAVPQAGP